MSRAVERKEHPLSMRLPEADIAIIDRAATLRGRSRTDFVRDAAVRAAEDVLMETMPVRMSPAWGSLRRIRIGLARELARACSNMHCNAASGPQTSSEVER